MDEFTLHSLDMANQKIKSEIGLNCDSMMMEFSTANHANGGIKRKILSLGRDDEDFENDPDDNDFGSDTTHERPEETMMPSGGNEGTRKPMPPNGKKTKGRVKIKMEFIDNKLRRYTTFSKRKTGIMKKAYELSTLTGTQVMLLVASETGHVYTFATRKLQPMITSESGKALIQTCLNSPDPPGGPGGSGLDQRMSATGFEEVDLTYTVADDTENKDSLSRCQGYYLGGSISSPASDSGDSSEACSPNRGPTSSPLNLGNHNGVVTFTSANLTSCSSQAQTSSHNTLVQTKSSCNTNTTSTGSSPTKALSLHLPQGQGYTTILTAGGSMPSALQLQQTVDRNPQTIYQFPSGANVNSNISSSSTNTVTVVPGNTQNLSLLSVVPSSNSTSLTSGLMYQTSQGMVYTSQRTSNLSEGVILNLGQDHGGSGQQFITIPVSLTQKQIVQSTNTSQPSSKKTKHRK